MLTSTTFNVTVEGSYLGSYTLPATLDKRASRWHFQYLAQHFFCPECGQVWCQHVPVNAPKVQRPHYALQRHCPKHGAKSLVPDEEYLTVYLDNFNLSLLEYEFLLRTQEMSHEQNA